jgi:hypothetical protein
MRKTSLIIIIIVLVIFAWSPWLTKAKVENLITQKFNAEWSGVSDGCGPIEEFKDTKRSLFGFKSSIRYACGMLPPGASLEGSWHSVYVSLFGTVQGDFLRIK